MMSPKQNPRWILPVTLAAVLAVLPLRGWAEEDGGPAAGPDLTIETSSTALDETAREALSSIDAERRQTQRAYEVLARQIAVSTQKRADLAEEVAALGRDQDRIGQALIDAAKSERDLERETAVLEERLGELVGEESQIRASFRDRRDVLAEVLAALQRMGMSPPPAILITPDDALGSVRSAILLGSVVPEIRDETAALLADLKRLEELRTSIDRERLALAANLANQAEERERLSLLLQARREQRRSREATLEAEVERVASLADEATSLQDLIASLDERAEETRRLAEERLAAAEEEARRTAAEAERRKTEEARIAAEQAAERARQLAALREANEKDYDSSLAAAPAFAALKGKLDLPVAGQVSSRFGSLDDTGSPRFGDTIQTQSGSIVSSPATGRVLFAGRYRSFGQLLIVDAGEGHHIVMGGMDRLFVEPSQIVLSGEPVGMMGETRLASMMAFDQANTQPQLYIEFRKDKTPIDPKDWWTSRKKEEVRP